MDEKKKKLHMSILGSLDNVDDVVKTSLDFMPLCVEKQKSLIELLNSSKPNANTDHWKIQLQEFLNGEVALRSLKKLTDNFRESLLKSNLNNLTLQYLNLVSSGFSGVSGIVDLKSRHHSLDHTIAKQPDLILEAIDLLTFTSSIEQIFLHTQPFTEQVIQIFAQFNTFEHVKDITHSMVIIGANGSGKSSFSRSVKKVLGNNIAIISAQKLFAYQAVQNIPTTNAPISQVHNHQADDKLGRDNNLTRFTNEDLKNLLLSLVSEHLQCALNSYGRHGEPETTVRQKSKLETVIEIWGSVILHRWLRYDKGQIFVNGDSVENEYSFSLLSDGEKAIFYYIAHVLLAKDDCYIIIDEPENHLHIGIVSKLWDILEKERSDCRFIYLTHDLDFASSRVNAVKLWNKKFIPPANWDVQRLPDGEEIPEKLLMELLGSRKSILFCEGAKSSLDYKLYSILFPDFTITPAGGHLDVISYTKAYNRSSEVFGNRAIGVIDGDFHIAKQISTWEKDSVFCIPVQEVENLLCDEKLLIAAKKQFLGGDDCIEKAKQKLLDKLATEIDVQPVQYATQRANNTLKSQMLKKQTVIETLKADILSLPSTLTVDQWHDDRKELLGDIVMKNDYGRALAHFNNKGIIGFVPQGIEKDYPSKVFTLLESNEELKKHLRETYFRKIPQFGSES